MLDFADQPYRFTPPAPNRLAAWLLKRVNRRWYLPARQRIAGVTVSGHDALRHARREGDAVLFLPNHPTHADAAILIDALRQIGARTRMMAAYDVFLRSRLDAWVMRKLGAFSVDREGSDKRAMEEAMRTLTELSTTGWALTIFPEGNVYLEGDRVTPFNDGAAFLALRAAKELAPKSPGHEGKTSGGGGAGVTSGGGGAGVTSGGGGGRVLAVPVSIKVTHTTDVRDALRDRLAALAAELGVGIDRAAPPAASLRAVGLAALRRNLKQRGLDQPDAPDLPALIRAAADAVLTDLEAKLEITPKPDDTPIDRVRAARRVIHQVRTDAGRAIDHAAARVWADQAMLGFRIASYSGDYLAAATTLDRVSETIDKLDEDLHARWPRPTAPRHAFVRFNPPIDVTAYLAIKRSRDAINQLTTATEHAVQSGLDHLNTDNPHVGGQDW